MNNFGFIRVAAATPVVAVADTETNTQRICALIEKGVEKQVSLLVFPEYCITGATCGDLFLQNLLLEAADDAISRIAAFCGGLPVTVIVSAPAKVNGKVGAYNFVISDGEVKLMVPKGENCIVDIGGARFSFAPCPSSHVVMMPEARPQDFTVHDTVRRDITAASSLDACACIYANAGFGESTTDSVFSGYSLIAENGQILAEGDEFLTQEQIVIADIDTQLIERQWVDIDCNTDEAPDPDVCLLPAETDFAANLYRPVDASPFIPDDSGLERAFRIQSAGLATRLRSINCSKAVIGISGGLDSTLALLCLIRTFDLLELDRKGIIAVTMPGFGTSSRTRSNASGLMHQLGVTSLEIDITESCRRHLSDIGHDTITQDVTFENAQARERTQILMDLANKENGIVIGTGDLSEIALGWCTYNGDHISNYSVNASIPKTLARAMVAYEADHAYAATSTGRTLHEVIDTPVSPELKGNGDGIVQKTEDIIGDYRLHDFFIWNTVHCGFTPEKTVFLARKAFGKQFSKKTITDCMKIFIKRFFSQQFKRSCSPDGPMVTPVSLSPRTGWAMPSDASARLFNDNIR